MKKITGISKVLLLLAAVMMVASVYFPIWQIQLDAPQYPEGLELKIHANGIRGDVDIINGLNHYIGMKTLHDADFIEFTVLPYIMYAFALLFLIALFIRKRTALYSVFTLFVLFGIIAMYDFWRWEYNYGHNLDPNAAIRVPGMAYQPPLIGFKQLLNFGAYSIPDIGGWLFIGAGLSLLIAVGVEFKKVRTSSHIAMTLIVLFSMSLFSCTAKVDKIIPGKDQCYFCKMGISDPAFGVALLTAKGKTYKFDDLHCFTDFMAAGVIEKKDIKQIFVSDHAGNHDLVPVESAYFLQCDALGSPMESNMAGFASKDSMEQLKKSVGGVIKTWGEIFK